MDIVKKCSKCMKVDSKIDLCARHANASIISKLDWDFPTTKRSTLKQSSDNPRPEPSFALTSKTCDEIPEGSVEKVWVAPYLTQVNIHGHAHDCIWKVSKAGRDYCLVLPCHH